MVSTRHHPDEFPEPSPTSSPSKALTKATSTLRKSGPWAHSPSNIALGWLFISLPLVAWDCGYVLLRPYSMPGGALHSPLWVPYALYGRIDHIYGWPAYNSNNGFTSAQGAMNVMESAMYCYYLYIVAKYGKSQAKGAKSNFATWWVMEEKTVPGMMGAVGAMVAFTGAVMTVAKTALYCEYPNIHIPPVNHFLTNFILVLNEAFSGFNHIGHNDAATIVFLWVIPK
jgi:hypothetical protein